ncbi:MAG: hypothetical protein ACXW08_14875 [Solirubrobacteraceae bacterium]
MADSEDTLRALVHGDLAAWHGAPADAGTDWVRSALGDGVDDSGGGMLSWHGGAAGPEGVLIWLNDGHVELIEMPDPDIPLDAMEPLGEPGYVARTPWSRTGRQQVWPARGLAVHATFDGVVRVMAFAPMTTEEYEVHRFATAGRPPRRP